MASLPSSQPPPSVSLPPPPPSSQSRPPSPPPRPSCPPPPPAQGIPPSRLRLGIEFAVLFGAIPLAIALVRVRPFVLPFLWAGAAGCTLVLLRDPAFDRRRLWSMAGWRDALPPMLLRFAVAAAALAVLLLCVRSEWLFRLPRQHPLLWCVILVLYPLLSVVPQGLVYRAFLFHRYRTLAPDRVLFVLAVLAFSFAHIPFRNWVAIALTLPGGWIFNRTYRRTQSLVLSCIEHALYGCLIFTLGYGEFFFHGSLRLARSVAGE